MPWNDEYFPAAVLHPSEAARNKAIAIANALPAEGMDGGRAIRLGIARAKEWALHQGVLVTDHPFTP